MKTHLTALTCFFLSFVLGCGGSSEPMGTLSGKVTFSGKPVPEGEVCVFSDSLKIGSQGTIKSDGTYKVTSPEGGLPPGKYAVYVVPPTIQLPDTADSPGGEGFKEVDNIPAKFRSHSSSGLSVTIAEGSNTLDIEMTDE